MAIFPCDTKGLCIDPANPFQNFSAEAPDQETFIGFSTGFGPTGSYPPLGSDFFAVGCRSFCESSASQREADLCAARQNVDCLSGVWPTATLGVDVFGNPVPVYRHRQTFLNREQTVTVTCPDGLTFDYTVPAGRYEAFTQEDADQAALSDATENAPLNIICISDLAPAQTCPNVDYFGSITATGGQLTDANVCWQLLGSLPPGLASDIDESDHGCLTGSRTLNFFGTPDTPGVFTFSIEVNDGANPPNFMVKTFTIRVEGIANVNPMPDAKLNQAYSQTLTPIGVTNPIYSLEAGNLPPGLSLDSTGVIFGTPTMSGNFNFTLGITEAGTGNTCNVPASITVKQACSPLPTKLFTVGIPAGNWQSITFRTAYASQIAPNNTPLLCMVNQTGGANSVKTISMKAGHAITSLTPSVTVFGVGYSAPNDLFVGIGPSGRILRIRPEPLAELSNTLLVTGGTVARGHSVTGLVYFYGNGSETLYAYNPATDTIVGSYDTGDPAVNFIGGISIDEVNSRLFVSVNDNNFSIGYVYVFDITGNAPVLLNAFSTPVSGGGTSVINNLVYCPTQTRVYVQFKFFGVGNIFLSRMNPTTGVFSNTQNIANGSGTTQLEAYNSVSDLILIQDGANYLVICPSADAQIGSFAMNNQTAAVFENFSNSIVIADVGVPDVESWG